MSRSTSITLRIVGIVLVLAIMAGVGFVAYQAGYNHGVDDSPEVTEAINNAKEDGGVVLYSHGIRSFSPFGMRSHSGFFPFGMICGLFFFGFLALCAMRLIFRPFWGGPWRMHPGWHHHPWGTPPWAQEEGKEPAKEESAKKE
jgi:hypothetical protein